MTDDKWTAGDAYEAYMGRWSRPLADVFVDWLQAKPSACWLDVGCGTGALTAAICRRAAPSDVVGCDPSAAFIEHARAISIDARASFANTGIDALPARDGGFDVIVSGLVLNFLPDPQRALATFRERTASDGLIAAYVWDYGQGMEFLRIFWEEAAALDARAAELHEGQRFPLCQRAALESAFQAAGLAHVKSTALEIRTDFSSFDDYWIPFLSGTGPAPSYVVSLEVEQREALKDRLVRRLTPTGDAPIRLHARAWAARGQLG